MQHKALIVLPFLVVAAFNLISKQSHAKPRESDGSSSHAGTCDAAGAYDIRCESYVILRDALPVARRQDTQRRSQLLRDIVRNDERLHNHPVLDVMRCGRLTPKALLDLHRDFQYFTKVFTDQITAIALATRELRPKYGNRVAMAARFLVFLNLLDEQIGRAHV